MSHCSYSDCGCTLWSEYSLYCHISPTNVHTSVTDVTFADNPGDSDVSILSLTGQWPRGLHIVTVVPAIRSVITYHWADCQYNVHMPSDDITHQEL